MLFEIHKQKSEKQTIIAYTSLESVPSKDPRAYKFFHFRQASTTKITLQLTRIANHKRCSSSRGYKNFFFFIKNMRFVLKNIFMFNKPIQHINMNIQLFGRRRVRKIGFPLHSEVSNF